jgi:hypothetical protein
MVVWWPSTKGVVASAGGAVHEWQLRHIELVFGNTGAIVAPGILHAGPIVGAFEIIEDVWIGGIGLPGSPPDGFPVSIIMNGV